MRLLVTKWYGVRTAGEDGTVDAERLFPADPAQIADRLATIRDGGVLAEERELAGDDVAVVDERLKELGQAAEGHAPTLAPPESHDADLLHQALLELGRRDAREHAGAPDRWLVHAVRVLDELNRTANTLTERLREWYGQADPSTADAIADQEEFVHHAAKGAPEEPDAGSLGASLPAAQGEAIASYARAVETLLDERSRLETGVTREATDVAPTLSRLVGETIAARLIAHAGGLDRLAFLPASTIQTLGAETALFDHLRHDSDPPKHGALFQHPAVNQAHPRLRGRAARTMAAKAALAARMDAFGDPDPDAVERLAKDLESGLQRVRESKPKPKAKRKRKGKGRGRGR